MKDRFEGPDGKRYVIECLKTQALIGHDETIAEEFFNAGKLKYYETGETIVTQGASDNDLFLILAGNTNVFIHSTRVATRGPGEAIGEMAMIDPKAPRSATVTAANPVATLCIAEREFAQIANKHPVLWKATAVLVGDKLRQRGSSIAPANILPVLFLGSSVEGLNVAKHIQLGLKHAKVNVQVWTDGVFGPGGVSIDSLMKQVGSSDFAAFVFGPDDQIASRGDMYFAPRDNVIFELGLFMGPLTRDRTFIVKEQNSDLKIPTDLLGITPITYVHHPGARLESTVGPVCTQLEGVIATLGTK